MDKLLECKVVKIENGESSCINELVVCEYPLTICLNGKKIATLLCSPEKLKELTLGFLSTEGIIESLEDIKYFKLDDVKALVEVETFDKNVFRKSFYSKKVELDNLKDNNLKDFKNFLQCIDCTPVVSKITLKANKVFEFMKKNLDFSEIFKKTGGLHCVALSDTEDIIIISEDVARHNALDKVVGEGLLKKIFLRIKF
uniref:Formate dehydrogenase chain D n=1 Tax=Clostridium carboxidivorans P7 TaxID=536227 RepID=E2IQB1_9CLOT|nr:formate dehydrogenase chain D [Clostridium carboxidivorans P7]